MLETLEHIPESFKESSDGTSFSFFSINGSPNSDSINKLLAKSLCSLDSSPRLDSINDSHNPDSIIEGLTGRLDSLSSVVFKLSNDTLVE